MSTVVKLPNFILRYIVPSILTRCRNSKMVVRGSGERISSRFIMKPEMGPVYHGRMYSERLRSPGVRRKHLRPLLAYRQNLLSTLQTIERHSTLQSTLSRHQCSRAWRCRGVSGSMARVKCDLSPDASRRFVMVLGDTAGANSVQISSLDAATAASTMRRS